jgi:hypothetical protein
MIVAGPVKLQKESIPNLIQRNSNQSSPVKLLIALGTGKSPSVPCHFGYNGMTSVTRTSQEYMG